MICRSYRSANLILGPQSILAGRMKRFPSKVDPLLQILLFLVAAGQVLALIAVLTAAPRQPEILFVGIAIVLGILLVVSILVRTHYTVTGDSLVIACGLFRWRVPLAEITDIVESRSLLSSPALSLDRLKISYGKKKWVLVSPDDKKGFLRTIDAARNIHVHTSENPES